MMRGWVLMNRNVSLLFVFMSILFVGAGVYSYCSAGGSGSSRDAALIVEWPSSDLGEQPLGHHVYQLRITNPNSTPRRVLGLSEGCRSNACFLSTHSGPITIPAGGVVNCSWDLDLTRPGDFDLPLILFLEEN